MQKRPLLVLAALAAATEPDFGRSTLDSLKDGFRDEFKNDPMGTTMKTVAIASFLFYKAEVGENPKVTSYYDALVYCSTCMSVGYSDIFAKTATGKAIGTFLMTYGPAMAAGFLDEPGKQQKEEAHEQAMLERLDRIVAALEARPAT